MQEYRLVPAHLRTSKIQSFEVTHQDEFIDNITVRVEGGGLEEFLIFRAEDGFIPKDFNEKVLRWLTGKTVKEAIPLLTRQLQDLERRRQTDAQHD